MGLTLVATPELLERLTQLSETLVAMDANLVDATVLEERRNDGDRDDLVADLVAAQELYKLAAHDLVEFVSHHATLLYGALAQLE